MTIRTVVLLTFTVLSAVRCSEITPHEACLTSRGNPVHVTCPDVGDRIQVNSVVYSEYANLSVNSGCDVDERELTCRADARLAFQPRLWKPILDCYGKENCSLTFGDAGKYGCGGYFLNLVRMNYSCVQADHLVELCGNLRRNITTTTQLSYLPESGKASRDCRCAVTGGHHVLKMIFVAIPPATLNCTMNFTVVSDEIKRGWKEYEYSIDLDIAGKPQSSTIHMVRECNRSYDTIVWLQITPDPGESLSLQCGLYATTTSHEETPGKRRHTTEQSSATTEKVTTATGVTSGEVNQPETNTGVIIGSNIGSALFGACFVLIIGFVVRIRRKEQKQKQLSTSTSSAQPDYEDLTMAHGSDKHHSKRVNSVYENSCGNNSEGLSVSVGDLDTAYYNVPGRATEVGVPESAGNHRYEHLAGPSGEGENKGEYSSLQAI